MICDGGFVCAFHIPALKLSVECLLAQVLQFPRRGCGRLQPLWLLLQAVQAAKNLGQRLLLPLQLSLSCSRISSNLPAC